MPRRRAGALVPLEQEVLRAGSRFGDDRFHGFALAQALRGEAGRSLVAHGTLYKALGRLLDAGLLTAAWEDPAEAEAARRPRRRLYALTAQGEAALAALDREERRTVVRPRTAEAGA